MTTTTDMQYDLDCFVFGSNLAGRHGRGAAQHALKYHGAIYGVGEGFTCNPDKQVSCYAIPTKDYKIQTLPLPAISESVATFIAFARDNQNILFHVTPIGCGLAGYTPSQIAPMFAPALEDSNILLPPQFLDILLTS